MLARIGPKCLHKASRGGIEPLARQRHEFVRPRQGAGRRCQACVAFLHRAADAALQPRRKGGDFGDKVRPYRNRLFCRGRGRGGPEVRGKVDERRIRLVSDRRNQRDLAGRGGAYHHLFVESPEVLEGTAAARHDDDVRPRRHAR